MRTAISNTYDMEQAPKERTPVYFDRPKLTGHCHKHGEVEIIVVRSRFFGTIPDKTLPPEKWELKSRKVCGICKSAIQTAPEEV